MLLVTDRGYIIKRVCDWLKRGDTPEQIVDALIDAFKFRGKSDADISACKEYAEFCINRIKYKTSLHKAVFDKDHHTKQELSNLSNEDIIAKVNDEEDSQVSCIYSFEEYNQYKKEGAFDNCYVLDVYVQSTHKK